MRMRAARLLVLLAALAAATPARADVLEANGLRLVKLGDFTSAVYVATAPGDPRRVFVVEQGSAGSADIRVIRDGVVLGTPFLHLTGVKTGGEQGLLSMAFAPDYPTSGRFYVYFTDGSACTGSGCDIRVDEYVRATDDLAGAFQRTLIRVAHPTNANHTGGQVAFGPDGLLYAATGDGGSGGDPPCNAQNPASNLGKVLRVDPGLPGTPAPQVYALGLRNPFRFSFDRLTGDLLVGDVGQATQEEVDFRAAGSAPGANFGWSWYEGTDAHSSTCVGSPPPGLIEPSITYPNPGTGAAVTGGVMVRDTSVPSLLGRYLYADFFVGDIRSALVGPGTASGDAATGLNVSQLTGFGQDDGCRVYVSSLAGPVYRLEAASPAGQPACQSPPAVSATPPAGPAPAAPGGSAGVDRRAPALTRVRLSRWRFRVARAGTPRVALVPLGTVIGYTVSEPGRVYLRFYRRSRGRPVFRLAGTLVRRRTRAGRASVYFTGRIGPRALPAGTYRLTLRARDAAGNVSTGRAVTLVIVR